MEKIIGFLKSKKDKHQLIKILIMLVFSFLLFLTKNVFAVIISIIIAVTSIVMLYFKIMGLINKKSPTTRKVVFSILTVIFIFVLMFSLSKDLPYLAKQILINADIDQYVTTNVVGFTDASIILEGKVNNIDTKFEMETAYKNDYKIGDEVRVYINSKDATQYIFVDPTLINMTFIGSFFLVDGIALALVIYPAKLTYRAFKPKKDNKVKVKVKS